MTPWGVIVDSRSCDSNGGCCDSRRCLCLCCTHFPCLEPDLWPVLRSVTALRWAGTGGVTCTRMGAQSYLC
eukprot:scaffold4013_cov140-Isochrysis_galbana.AAC.7